MPALTYTIGQFLPFTKIVSSDVNQYFTDIKTLLNSTKLDSANVQQYGLTRDRLAQTTASQVLINDGSGTMTSEAQLAITRGGLAQDFTSTMATSAGLPLIVNPGGTAWSIGSALQSTITESLTSVVSSLTAGEAITANNACCLDAALDGSSNNIYRVFNADYTKVNRRTSFLGFAQAGATVTAGIYTWVASANFVTSNVITYSINGRSYTTNFTTDNPTTLQAVATQMATDPDVNGAVSDGSHTVTVTGKGGLFINITGSTVTGGASQPTITVTNTQAPSGQNVKIQCFGPLGGFSSLTPLALYYLNTGGGITTTPADTNPIVVGQALSATVLFITTNPNVFKFSTPVTLVRSHGSSTSAAAGAVQDVEHYNFSSWSSGASSSNGARYAAQCGGQGNYAGFHWQVDGANTSNSVAALTQSYNKAAWATGATRGTPTNSWAGNNFNGFLYVCKGSTTTSNASTVATTSKWNGSAWANGTSFATAAQLSGAFIQGGLLHIVGGNTTTAHETMNSSDVLGSATAVPGAGTYTGGSGNHSTGGIYADYNSTSSFSWTGSWSAALTIPYEFDASQFLNAACAYNTTNQILYANGGNTTGTTIVNNTAQFNSTAWASGTASTNSRCSASASAI